MPQPPRATPRAQRTAPTGTRTPRNPQTGGLPLTASVLLVAAINEPSRQLIQGGAAAQAAVTRELAEGSIRTLAGGVALAYRAASIRRRRVLPAAVGDLFRRTRHGATPEEVAEAVRHELAREMTFRRRQGARLRRKLGQALREPTAARRDRAVQGVIDSERHYSTLREEAVAARAAGAADALNTRDAEPLAPVWTLGARETHTPDCRLLHGHAIRWEALEAERMIPPVHHGCGCRLRARVEAYFEGIAPTVRRVPSIEESLALIARAKRAAHEAPDGVLIGAAHVG